MKHPLVFIILIITLFTSFLCLGPIIEAKVNLGRRIGAYFLELLHCLYIAFFLIGMIWLFIKAALFNSYDVSFLFLLNILYLIVVFQFSISKLCLANVFYNQILGLDKCTEYYSVTDMFFGKPMTSLEERHTDCMASQDKWFFGNRIFLISLITINCMYFWHFYNKSCF
jgi:hypothetical protein